MTPLALDLALQISLQMMQGVQAWQTKIAAGTITDADLDAKIAEMKIGSRADLVQAITEARALRPA